MEYNDNNNINKKQHKKGIIVPVLLVLVIIGLVGYILYDKGIICNQTTQNEVKSESNIQTKGDEVNNNADVRKTLDIKSGIVQSLFKLVNVDSISMEWKNENGTSAENMTYQEKFIIATYAVMAENAAKYVNVKCDDIKDEITKIHGTTSEISCGNDVYDQLTFNVFTKKWERESNRIYYTSLYKEENIKNAMYQIFGKDSYERKDTIEDGGVDYTYIASENGYVSISGQKGGTKPFFTETLRSAEIVNDELILTVDAQSDVSATIKYTFKYNNDDLSYYFSKIEINKKN